MSEKVMTYNKEQFEALPAAEQNNVLLKAVKVEGTVIVRRADGSIKYDDESLKGTYGEGEIA